MQLNHRRWPLFAGLLVFGASFAPMSQAALGGNVASVMHDHEALGVAPVVTATASYDLYQGQSAAGATLREYVDRSGKVFAVTYQGTTRPNLTDLLGSYAPRFQAAALAHRAGSHHVLAINDPDFGVSVVHMGRGWRVFSTLPAAIPAGVNRAEIR